MAEAGRFMTKWEMVGGRGMVSVRVVVVLPRGFFCCCCFCFCRFGEDWGLAFSLWVMVACSPFREAARTESAA